VKRSAIIVVLACLLVGGTTGCIKAKAGARCRTTEWGDDGRYVLQCKAGRWRRVMTRQQAAAAIAKVIEASRKPGMGEVVRPTSYRTPQLPNMADPAVYVENGTTYVYATTNFRRVPVVPLTDVDRVYTSGELYSMTTNAMPGQAAWAATAEVWAPTVAKIGNRYVMFFAAHRSNPVVPQQDQCVGRAFASSPLGPFVPDAAPITCGNDGVHGALDPSVFTAPDGNAFLLVAMAGSQTNIWSFPLDINADLSGPSSGMVVMNQPWHEWFLENPAMYWDGTNYLLAYSVGHWDSGSYRTGLARCATPTGPCTDRSDGPWLSSTGGREGPGGLEFFVGSDGVPRVVFHSYAAGDIGTVGKRSTHIEQLHTDPWPRIT
jgi:hypothetical protein